MSLALYNSLTRRKELLEKYAPDRKVGMYVCGPTVYDESHIGHARSAFTFEIMRRYLTFRKYDVTFVRNVTDVDDKIIERARKEGGELKLAVRNVSERYLSLYHEEMGKLGISPTTEEPKATEYIAAMQEMVQEILRNNAAYVSGKDVYFDVKRARSYGKLSRRNLEEMLEGTRGEPVENKRSPLDFALWKGAKPEEPAWESPWGMGRPGWHIECSTMSTEIFKKRNVPFVIHGGGLDLIFPHHENEIAQAEGAGRPFAPLWVHNGLVTVNGQKMAKSLGNFITLRELFEKVEPEVIRFYFLQTHYRNPLDFSWEKLNEVSRDLNSFYLFFDEVDGLPQKGEGGKLENLDELTRFLNEKKEAFIKAMDDDLNSPEALARTFEILEIGNKVLKDPKVRLHGEGFGLLQTYCETLKTLLRETFLLDFYSFEMRRDNKQKDFEEANKKLRLTSGVSAADILNTAMAARESYRKMKNYQKSDRIRKEFEKIGIIFLDNEDGTSGVSILP